MLHRREIAMGLLLGVPLAMTNLPSALAAGVEASEAEALAALDPWADALFNGDPEKITSVLADEYQIVRSDGSGFNKTEYMSNLPKQKARVQFSKVVATRQDTLMVIRYMAETDQTISGKLVKGVSPRLSGCRKEGERWLMALHASFAPLG
ncbi:MAG: nuclear transport factor 2 family protein [Alphaproteobacteria bacterium]|nr:nuclear transport factor 2 family protein [Alphaproteobacteria bacterium]